MMKLNTILSRVLLLLLLCCTYVGSEARVPAKRHTIVDYVNKYVAEPEDEFTGALYDAWQHYLRQEPQDDGVTLVVDKAHGFMQYINNDTENSWKMIAEMCYWNCSDLTHRLLAVNVYSWRDGYYSTQGQFDGISFIRITTATNEWEYIGIDDVGVDPFIGIPFIGSGYNADLNSFYIFDEDDNLTYITDEEFKQWERNRPVNIFTLPREGKDIEVTYHTGLEQRHNATYHWDGERFSAQ